MSPVGIVNTIVASSVVDKVNTAQQLQIDIQQKQLEAQAVREQNVKRATVQNSPDGEKVRMRQRSDEEKEKGRQQGQSGSQEEENTENEEQQPNHKHINVTV